MKPWNRKSPRPSRGQSPKLDRFDTPEHGAEESRDLTASGTPASADDISPLPIDFARLREAERRLEADLVEVEALIWSRLQETLRTEGRGGQPHDPRHAHKGANPGLRSQARYGNRPRRGQALNRGATSTPQDADQGGRPPASATRMADLLDLLFGMNFTKLRDSWGARTITAKSSKQLPAMHWARPSGQCDMKPIPRSRRSPTRNDDLYGA